MENYTDLLLELYTAKPGASDTEKQDAEKAYLAAAKEGWRDTDNFHKAYDDIIEAEDLLDCFKDDGELLNRGTYGRVNAGDTPAKKVVKQFWVYTYSTSPSKFPPYKPQALKSKEEWAAYSAEKARKEKEAAIKANCIKASDTIKNRLDGDFGLLEKDLVAIAKKIGLWSRYDDKLLDVTVKASGDIDDPSYILRAVINSSFVSGKGSVEVSTKNLEDITTDYSTYTTIKDFVSEKFTELSKYYLKATEEKNKREELFKFMGIDITHRMLRYYRLSNNKLVTIPADYREPCKEYYSGKEITVTKADKPMPVLSVCTSCTDGRCYVDRKTYLSFCADELTRRDMSEFGILDAMDAISSDKKSYFGSCYKVYSKFPATPVGVFEDLPMYDTWIYDRYECDSGD